MYYKINGKIVRNNDNNTVEHFQMYSNPDVSYKWLWISLIVIIVLFLLFFIVTYISSCSRKLKCGKK